MSIVFLILGIMGVCMIMSGFWKFREAWNSLSWATTTGTITSIVVKHKGGGGSTSPGYKGSYFAKVTYQYEVDGKEYVNDRRCFGDYGGGENRAHTIAASYQEGKPVEVIYNPQNPQEAVLESGMRMSQFLPIVIGAVFIGGGWLGMMKYGYPWLVSS